jgi:YgiT-type zinc finger domain-containing protein
VKNERVPQLWRLLFLRGEVKEKVIEVEFRWKGKLYILEGVPTGVCQQSGEKYFTVQVSEAIDRSINQRRNVKRTVEIPVLEIGFSA